uniref:Cation transport ATPase n=1 Tax=Ganoderma boninense TaxID=34458 RepID=A0A5K1JZY0_9APHY|nr:Cation transport ATPase [Ganoderma boninense]
MQRPQLLLLYLSPSLLHVVSALSRHVPFLTHLFVPLEPRHFVMPDENVPPQTAQKRPLDDSALTLPPRKKAGALDPWKRKGRHIGRTIHAFANFPQLITNGIQMDKDLALLPDSEIEKFPLEVRHQYDIYNQIMEQLPALCQGLSKESIDASHLHSICTSLQAGVNASRSDDVKGLKGVVVDWLIKSPSGNTPPLDRDEMSGRGFGHPVSGRELCPAGLDWTDPRIHNGLKSGSMIVKSDQWPIFIYLNGVYDPDSPWTGLLRGRLLVNVSVQAYLHFSKLCKELKSIDQVKQRLDARDDEGDASLHRVRGDSRTRSTFASNDTSADYQSFYNLLLGFLAHPAEREKVNDLLSWWNKQVFPNYVSSSYAPTANSPLARLTQNRNVPATNGTNLASSSS